MAQPRVNSIQLKSTGRECDTKMVNVVAFFHVETHWFRVKNFEVYMVLPERVEHVGGARFVQWKIRPIVMNAQKHLLRRNVLDEIILIRFFHKKRAYLYGICDSCILLIQRFCMNVWEYVSGRDTTLIKWIVLTGLAFENCALMKSIKYTSKWSIFSLVLSRLDEYHQ